MKPNFYRVIFAIAVISVFLLSVNTVYPAKQTGGAGQGKDLIIHYSEDTLSIRAHNVPIADVLLEISRETGIEFIYNKSDFRNKTTFEIAQTPIREAIKELFRACGIKNYSIIAGTERPIELVELLPGLTPSPYTPPPIIEKEPELTFPEEEEEIYEEGEPIITHIKRPPPEVEVPTEEEAIPPEELAPEEEEEEEKEFITRQPGTVEIRDASSEYRPPGSKRRTPTVQPISDEPLRDMSDQYHPPGYTPGEKKAKDTPVYDSGPLPDMSDQYHPPGYRP